MAGFCLVRSMQKKTKQIKSFDKEGKELDVFTKAFVQETADLIRDFVVSIEKVVRARSK